MFTDAMTLGDKLVSGLGLTILGMLVVFVVLILLSFALDLLRIVAEDKNKKKITPSKEVIKSEDTVITSNDNEQEELIAVIAAAIAATSGASINDIFVKSIKSIPQKNTIWATSGRQQRMLEKF